jgi:peptidyl-tRNA hydrolase, PTH1 family
VKLIVGLGNPGERYKFTRHNLGFLVVQAMAEKYNFSFKAETRFKGMLAKGAIGSEDCMFLLPTTFMNLSGESVAKVSQFFKVPIEDVLIVYDDVDILFGEIKLRAKGGTGGHNGLKDIKRLLSSNDFARLRMGIMGQRFGDLSDFVLQKFSKQEMEKLPFIIDEGIEWIESCMGKSIDEALKAQNDEKQQVQSQKKKKLSKESPGDWQQEKANEQE